MNAGLKSVFYKPIYIAAHLDSDQWANYHVEPTRVTNTSPCDTTVIPPGSGAPSALTCNWRQHSMTQLGPGTQLTAQFHPRHLNARPSPPLQPQIQRLGKMAKIPPFQLRSAPTHRAITEGLYVEVRACPLQGFIGTPPAPSSHAW